MGADEHLTEHGTAFELRHVSKDFATEDGTLVAVEDVEIHAGVGEFVSIIGPSGCGKSTLLKMVAGLERPTAGEILVNGEVTAGRSDRVAYMPQKDLLFPWRTVLDNTTLGLEVQGMGRVAAREKAGALFEVFGLDGFERSRPWQLSGGMRQRAALLRTVVQEKPVLLLDEPMGALDSLTRLEMQEWLTDVWERFRWTVALITHDIREAIFLSDRIYVLTPRPGRVRAEFEVPLERPRRIEVVTDPRYLALERELLAVLRDDHPASPSVPADG